MLKNIATAGGIWWDRLPVPPPSPAPNPRNGFFSLPLFPAPTPTSTFLRVLKTGQFFREFIKYQGSKVSETKTDVGCELPAHRPGARGPFF